MDGGLASPGQAMIYTIYGDGCKDAYDMQHPLERRCLARDGKALEMA